MRWSWGVCCPSCLRVGLTVFRTKNFLCMSCGDRLMVEWFEEFSG